MGNSEIKGKVFMEKKKRNFQTNICVFTSHVEGKEIRRENPEY